MLVSSIYICTSYRGCNKNTGQYAKRNGDILWFIGNLVDLRRAQCFWNNGPVESFFRCRKEVSVTDYVLVIYYVIKTVTRSRLVL